MDLRVAHKHFYERIIGIPSDQSLFGFKAITWAKLAAFLLLFIIIYFVLIIPVLLIMTTQSHLRDLIIPKFIILFSFLLLDITFCSWIPFMSNYFQTKSTIDFNKFITNVDVQYLKNRSRSFALLFIPIGIIILFIGFILLLFYPHDIFNGLFIICGLLIYSVPVLLFGMLSLIVFKRQSSKTH